MTLGCNFLLNSLKGKRKLETSPQNGQIWSRTRLPKNKDKKYNSGFIHVLGRVGTISQSLSVFNVSNVCI